MMSSGMSANLRLIYLYLLWGIEIYVLISTVKNFPRCGYGAINEELTCQSKSSVGVPQLLGSFILSPPTINDVLLGSSLSSL